MSVPGKTRNRTQRSRTDEVSQNEIDASKPLVRAAKDLECVTKVVIGEAVEVGPGKQRIKFAPVPKGLRVTVRGSILQQWLFLYTTERQTVQACIERAWNEAKS